MWSYLAGSVSTPEERFALELLRTRVTSRRSRRDELDTAAVSGSDGVEIWLSRSAAGVKTALWVWGRGPVSRVFEKSPLTG